MIFEQQLKPSQHCIV